jgi:hypothetical protein
MLILNNYPNSVYSQQIENFEKVEVLSTFAPIKTPTPYLCYNTLQRNLRFIPQFPQMLWGQIWGQVT